MQLFHFVLENQMSRWFLCEEMAADAMEEAAESFGETSCFIEFYQSNEDETELFYVGNFYMANGTIVFERV